MFLSFQRLLYEILSNFRVGNTNVASSSSASCGFPTAKSVEDILSEIAPVLAINVSKIVDQFFLSNFVLHRSGCVPLFLFSMNLSQFSSFSICNRKLLPCKSHKTFIMFTLNFYRVLAEKLGRGTSLDFGRIVGQLINPLESSFLGCIIFPLDMMLMLPLFYFILDDTTQNSWSFFFRHDPLERDCKYIIELLAIL